MEKELFLEVFSDSHCKWNQRVCGDTFIAKRIKEERRTVAVLSDGLGSGIKAHVLSTLTATMALKYMANCLNIEKAASVIMQTLPVCKKRKISYATFTIIDISANQKVNIVEYDNPSYLLVRNGYLIPVNKNRSVLHNENREVNLYFSSFDIQQGDRIIFHSDGLNQSGMGKQSTPFGWGEEGVRNSATGLIIQKPTISARSLAKYMVEKAIQNDDWKCGDDTTCAVIYYRKPRKLLVISGPPLDRENDPLLGEIFNSFDGTRIVCGGTTAKIISRVLDKKLIMDFKKLHPQVPPTSIMEGADLVTEGIITLTKAIEYLCQDTIPDTSDGAARFADLLINSDEISFIIGTRFNEANRYQNGKTIEFRDTVINKISEILENKYLKNTSIRYI
ncbi:MAG: SpoIIE family protein phosphatase [Fibrobacter sp.]|nr:SpoIIE family protein phosphatase [Fibrobacter sp.]